MIKADRTMELVKEILKEAGQICHKADLDVCVCVERRESTLRAVTGLLLNWPPQDIGENLVEAMLPDSLEKFLKEYSGVQVQIPEKPKAYWRRNSIQIGGQEIRLKQAWHTSAEKTPGS